MSSNESDLDSFTDISIPSDFELDTETSDGESQQDHDSERSVSNVDLDRDRETSDGEAQLDHDSVRSVGEVELVQDSETNAGEAASASNMDFAGETSEPSETKALHCRALSETTPKKRKRGGFKAGFLTRRKKYKQNPTLHSGDSGDQSEDYLESLAAVLSEDPSDGGATSTAVSDSFPSEGETDTSKEEEGNEQPELSPDFVVKRKAVKRKLAPIGRKTKKQSWKKIKVEPKDDNIEDQDKEPRKDKETLVDQKDLLESVLSSSTANDYLPTVVYYLKLLLDQSWTVSNSSDTLNITRLSNPLNPYVERSITWTNNKINIFVLNHQLPSTHLLWHQVSPDTSNWGSVADYLAKVANRFLYFEVCTGVTSNEEVWPTFSASGHGSVSTHLELPCIRSTNCSLLIIYPSKCSKCGKLQRQMLEHKRQKTRTAAKQNADKTKVNTRYLQVHELDAKLARIRKEKKMSAQTLKRMTKRIEQLLLEKKERLDKQLSNDFVQIMNDNVHKMSEVERLFWAQQSEALKKRENLRTMEWHPTMIRLALHFRMLSPAAYDFMSGILCLPSSRRLFDYSQFTDIEEGVQQDLLDELTKLIGTMCSEDYEKYFSLLLDEMSIRSDLVYSSRTGELIGFTNLTSLEEELASLEAEIAGKNYEKKLAKKVLVFMLTGCANPISFVAAVYSTDDLSAAQLYTRTWDVIYAVEEAGAKVLNVIFDGASVNRKFIRMHFNMGSKDYVHVTTNLASGEKRLIYFMLDPPHLLKTFRNCLANSFSHRKSRQLFKNGQNLSWKAIEALFELSKHDKYKSTKLTKGHVYLTSFSCMNVSLAAQVFSRLVALALRNKKDLEPLRQHFSEELVVFIELMNKCFDCLNGGEASSKKKDNPDLLEYTADSDPRLKFLEEDVIGYLEDWERDTKLREGNFTKDQRAKMCISYQSVEGVKITINSFTAVCCFLLQKGAPSVSSRKFNQDPLEQKFADFRRAEGSNDNPNLKQVLHTRLSLHAQGQVVSTSKRGNTEVRKRNLTVDDTPLPVRKKSNK